MIILQESIEPQTINFIPRSYGADTIILRNEITNEVQTISAEFYLNNYYLTTTTVFDIKEKNTYNITITNGNEVVYKDKIFCTNQVISDYTINQNEYVANVTSNEFIIYE